MTICNVLYHESAFLYIMDLHICIYSLPRKYVYKRIYKLTIHFLCLKFVENSIITVLSLLFNILDTGLTKF